MSSFIDALRLDNDMPNGWTDYNFHLEVNVMEFEIIHHLENTESETVWYGLDLEAVRKYRK